jgi:hypothetical protein
MGDRSIVAWSNIATFLALCVWFDWPEDPSGRAYEVAGLAFIATPVGMVVAAVYAVHIRGRSLRDIAWGATKMTLRDDCSDSRAFRLCVRVPLAG